jgi:hypothetical protein
MNAGAIKPHLMYRPNKSKLNLKTKFYDGKGFAYSRISKRCDKKLTNEPDT